MEPRLVGVVLVDHAGEYAKYWPRVFFEHRDVSVLVQADAAHPAHAPHRWMDVYVRAEEMLAHAADAPPAAD